MILFNVSFFPQPTFFKSNFPHFENFVIVYLKRKFLTASWYTDAPAGRHSQSYMAGGTLADFPVGTGRYEMP